MAITYANGFFGCCRRPFTRTNEHQCICVECGERFRESGAERLEEIRAEFEERKRRAWMKICPPLYRVSDPARLPAAAVQAINDYTFGRVGLGLIGPARIGKTRTMFQLIRRFIFTEVRPEGKYIYGPEFSSEVASHGAEFYKILGPLQTAPFLFFDDIGAGRFTPAVEANFLLLLETRAKNELPTFWTSNVGPVGLASLLSHENGPRVIGRLGDFSTVIDL